MPANKVRGCIYPPFKIFIYLICLLFSPTFSSIAYGYEPPILKLEDRSHYQLTGYVAALEDKQKQLEITQLLSPEIEKSFVKFDRPNDSIGVTKSIWWFKFQLDFTAIAQQTRFLLIDSALINNAQLFQLHQGQLIALYRGGFAFPASERPVFDTELIFPLKNQAGIAKYYLKIENQGALKVPLSVWKAEALAGSKNMDHWLYGIYYGLIISMAIYNLFIGWSTKVTAYFYYVGYLIALLMAIAFNDGYSQLLLFTDSPYIAYAGINWSAALVIIFGSQFARDFLNSKLNTPWVDKWLIANIGAALLYLLLNSFFRGANNANIILLLILVFVSSMLTVGILCWHKKVRAAKYFVFSWVFMVSGTFMMALTKLGLFPSAAIGEYGVHIGSAIEAMLLSFALAARISWLEKQRINAEKETRKALEISHKKLEESNRIKDEFFSSLSHELRTPMNGIRGIVDILAQDDLTDKQSDNLSILNESTNEMLCHVDQLLVFSQLKSNHLKLNQRPFNLISLIQRLKEHSYLVCKEQKIKFYTDIPPELCPRLIGDQRVLLVILNQLLDKHIKNKNTREIYLLIQQQDCPQETYHIKLTFILRSKAYASHNMNINQPAIADEDSADILHLKTPFEPESIAKVESLLNQKLVSLLHGELSEKSAASELNDNEQNYETKLVLSFKAAKEELPQTKGETVRSEKTGLVVDDNAVNRIVANKYLEQLGYQVDSVSDGEEAVLALKNATYDFILMDCHMPIMDGFKATRMIRKGTQQPNIPIIAVTADVTAESTQECFNCGMNEVLHKPLSLDKLSETLKAHGLYPKKQSR